MMVSDGMGPSSLSLARSVAAITGDLEPDSQQLFLDLHMIGTSRTRSSDSLITDSAAGATAFSCALHSYNNAIGVDKHGRPCGTVLEAAKRAGLATGLVVTSDITDATPASFSSHVRNRSSENVIAQQQIGDIPLGRTVDLMLGGGYCHYLPQSNPQSCRTDERDLFTEARNNGFEVVGKDLEISSLPALGLFAPWNLDYEIDRTDQPSLEQMAIKALDMLERQSPHGFFLMVEGSRIDMASHANDPAAHARDVLAYNRAFRAVHRWLDGRGILIATSDHETGGVATGLQLTPLYPPYEWFPQALVDTKHSTEWLAPRIRDRRDIEEGLGFDVTQGQADQVLSSSNRAYALSKLVSERARIGYTTHGHTAADVLIFGNTDHMRGNHENIEIGGFLASALRVDLEPITKELNLNTSGWFE
ncbi:hypothetical protein PYCC9005_003039 [Savitreella phatthalungensis]